MNIIGQSVTSYGTYVDKGDGFRSFLKLSNFL